MINIDEWQHGYDSLKEEFAYQIDQVEGEIPADLQGTLFRNGPGLLDVNGVQLQHPFDGDGMVCAITFDRGQAYFRNRFVRTEGYVAEQQAGKILYRGVFGTQKPGGLLANAFDLRLKNIANTQVIYWGNKLLALWEAGSPHRLDPVTLATWGEETFNDRLPLGEPFAAHPMIDPGDGKRQPRLVNFSIKPGLSTTLKVYELNTAGEIVQEQTRSIPGFAFIHDFAITPNYCLFFQNPVSFNPLPYVFGWRGPGECVKFEGDRPTQVWLVPRDPDRPLIQLQTDPCFVFHHANAFEQGDEVIVDSICYQDFPSVDHGQDYRQTDFAALSPGQIWRFRLHLTQQTVDRQCLDPRCCEFPFVHPQRIGQPYRYVFLGAAHLPQGNAPLQAILKLDLETGAQEFWSAAPTGYVGEPILVPRNPSAKTLACLPEDAAWLLTLVYDGSQHRSEVVILDAADLNAGPVARLKLKHHVPYGLHGSFTPRIFRDT